MKKDHAYLSRLKSQYDDGRVSRREFLRTATLLGASSVAAYGMLGLRSPAYALLMEADGAMPRGGTLRISLPVQGVEKVHAISWGEAANYSRQTLEYLTRTDADNITRPYLLESWEPSDDLRTWTLNLRKGIKWHSGEDLRADHIVWNLNDLLDPAVGSSVLGLMKDYMLTEVDGGTRDADGKPVMQTQLWDANAIEKVDDHTIRLNLKQAQLAVPEHLFHFPALIVHPDDPVFREGINGTGPFICTAYEPGRLVRHEANPNYWRPGLPYLDAIEFRDLGDDVAASVAALVSDQVDAVGEVTETEARLLRTRDDIVVYDSVSAETLVARVRADQEPFTDARVRKAMRLAADTSAALAAGALGNGALADHSHVSPIHPEHANIPLMERDVEAARALLAEAGYPDGIDIEISCKNTPPDEARVAEVLAQSWGEAGIRTRINVMPSSSYWDVWTEVPVGLTSWSHRPLGVMVLGLAYRSGVPWNESHFSNPEFDSLLAEAEGIPDPEARAKVMEKIQILMQEEGPITQPYWVKMLQPYNRRVQNARCHPSRYIFGEELAIQS